jgi:hypothetical protein
MKDGAGKLDWREFAQVSGDWRQVPRTCMAVVAKFDGQLQHPHSI